MPWLLSPMATVAAPAPAALGEVRDVAGGEDRREDVHLRDAAGEHGAVPSAAQRERELGLARAGGPDELIRR